MARDPNPPRKFFPGANFFHPPPPPRVVRCLKIGDIQRLVGGDSGVDGLRPHLFPAGLGYWDGDTHIRGNAFVRSQGLAHSTQRHASGRRDGYALQNTLLRLLSLEQGSFLKHG